MHFRRRRRLGRVSGGELSNRDHPTPRALRGDVEMKGAGRPEVALDAPRM